MITFFRLLRIHHWIKNTILFAVIFFDNKIFHTSYVMKASLGFIAFSLMSSAVYILNDYIDVEADRRHPEKRKRPLAAGEVTDRSAFFISSVLCLTSLGMAFFIHLHLLFLLLGYFGMNLIYSFTLKHIPILDICIIAAGFILRVLAGGMITDIFISKWILIMTFLLALFLGLAKRKNDVIILRESGEKMRGSIDGYNLEFINVSMFLMAAVIIVSYIMYTVSDDVIRRLGSGQLYITTLFVIVGLLRYLQLSIVHQNTGSPIKTLFKDTFLQLTLLGWITVFYFLIYL